jgi:ferric-dicitrate binding protein FerR (iron transport regulator)
MSTETIPKKTPLQKARERAEELAKQAQQARAKAQRLEAKARAQQAGAERSRDTKRKVLLGAYIMAQAKAQGWELAALHIGQQTLADYLTRDEDRALFSLPPIPVLTAQVQEPESEGAEAPSADQP